MKSSSSIDVHEARGDDDSDGDGDDDGDDDDCSTRSVICTFRDSSLRMSISIGRNWRIRMMMIMMVLAMMTATMMSLMTPTTTKRLILFFFLRARPRHREAVQSSPSCGALLART